MKIDNYLPKSVNDLENDKKIIAEKIINWIKNF